MLSSSLISSSVLLTDNLLPQSCSWVEGSSLCHRDGAAKCRRVSKIGHEHLAFSLQTFGYILDLLSFFLCALLATSLHFWAFACMSSWTGGAVRQISQALLQLFVPSNANSRNRLPLWSLAAFFQLCIIHSLLGSLRKRRCLSASGHFQLLQAHASCSQRSIAPQNCHLMLTFIERQKE